MHCILTTSKEYQDLKQQVNIDDRTLKAVIAVFQEDNGLDKWPTPSDLGYAAKSIIKPGVSELFESNPELANAVYEALGLKKIYHGSKTTEKYLEYKTPTNKGVDSLGSFFTSDLDGALMFTPDFIDESPIAKDIKERTGKITYKKYLSYVKEEYLKLQNPYKIDIKRWEDNSWLNDFVKGDFSSYNFDEVPSEIVDRVKKILIDRGHDGIYIAKDFYVGNMESKYDQYIVFDPNKTLKQQKQQAIQLYSQYLEQIFPSSRVKDIVYHGTDYRSYKEILKNGFDLNYFGKTDYGDRGYGIYLSFDSENTKMYGNKVIKAITNTSNPYYVKSSSYQIEKYFNRLNTDKNPYVEQLEEIIQDRKKWINKVNNHDTNYGFFIDFKGDKNNKKELLDYVNDTFDERENSIKIAIKNYSELSSYDSVIKDNYEIVVKPEQIHILGSKQDIENFANFVAYENSDFSKIGNINQFRDYIMSKNFAAIEEFLVVNNKIDRKC